jgi:hypothetical protein
MSPVVGTWPQPNCTKRLECVELAPAFGPPHALRQRQQAGRTPNAPRGSSSTRTFAACEDIGVKQCKDAKTQGFRLLGTFTRWVRNLSLSFPPHLPAPCVLASWR